MGISGIFAMGGGCGYGDYHHHKGHYKGHYGKHGYGYGYGKYGYHHKGYRKCYSNGGLLGLGILGGGSYCY